MQYHASLITADGAYHRPVGSIMAIFFVVVVDVDAPGEEKTGVEKAVMGDVDVGVRDSSIFPTHFCNCLFF